MKEIIHKILKEEVNRQETFMRKILKHVKLPYFKHMEYLGLNDNEKEYVLNKIFNQPVSIENQSIYDAQGNKIYREYSNGYWEKSEYDNGKEIYFENSNGYWRKSEYDDNGDIIYREYSDGNWEKSEYDKTGNKIYFENSYGDWIKSEYDDNGNLIYNEIKYERN